MSTEVNAILSERGSRYGEFTTQANLSQKLLSLLNLGKMTAVQREAVQMICCKLSRISTGDQNYADNWLDIAGYATLAADRCPKPKVVDPMLSVNEQMAQAQAQAQGKCFSNGILDIGRMLPDEH